MSDFIYIVLRFFYFIGPFFIGTIISKVAIHREEKIVSQRNLGTLALLIALLTLAAGITYSTIYPGTSANVGLVYLISLSAGIILPGWWPYVRKMLSKPEMRYLKIFIFLYLACCILDHIPYEISSFIVLAVFSLMILAFWELKLYYRPSKNLLDDEI